MKAKMFKKVLAAMLAASSVMAMSGVAMAAKKAPGSGKSHGASKTPAQSGKKVMKSKKNKAGGKRKNKKAKQFKQKEVCDICKNEQVSTLSAPDDVAAKSDNGEVADIINSTRDWKLDLYKKRPVEDLVVPEGLPVFDVMYNENSDRDKKIKLDCESEHFYTLWMGKKDMLSQDCCNDTFVLETTNEIRHLKHCHLIHCLKDCPEGKEQELVDALISWAKSDTITVKRNIAVAIGDLAQEGFFDDLPREKKKDVLDALVNCVDRDPLAKPDVAWAFKRLVECRFVNGNEPSEAVLKLQAILNDCKDSCDFEPHLDVDDYDSDSCEI